MGSKKQTSLLKEHFEPVMSDDDQSLSDSDASTSSQDEPANGMKDKSRVPRWECYQFFVRFLFLYMGDK